MKEKATTEDDESFDLVDDPWILCAMIDGSVGTLSLRQVFQSAPDIRRISGDSPQQDYALLRVLLVIFWRAHRKDTYLEGFDPRFHDWWLGMFESIDDSAPWKSVEEYLEEHRLRFNLLSKSAPFMQVAGLRTSRDSKSNVERMIPEAESDYFTMRAGPGLESLSFAEAARQLIAVHAWDYSGIKPGAEGDQRVKGGKGYPIGTGWAGRTGGVVVHGQNLAETLVLNTVPSMVFAEDDLPVWERPADNASPRDPEIPEGPCDLLTWQSRRVRLFVEDGAITGVLIANGDRIERKNEFNDPMTAYRHSTNLSTKAQKVSMARTHATERTLWRGIQPLLVREGVGKYRKGEEPDRPPATVEWLTRITNDDSIQFDFPLGIELVGMVYGNQDAVLDDSIHEMLPIKVGVLADPEGIFALDIVASAQAAMDAAVAVGQFAGNLLHAAGGEYVFVKEPTEAVLAGLVVPYRQWLAEINASTDMKEHRDQWFDLVRRGVLDEAAALVKGAGPRALAGRFDGDRLVSASNAMGQLRGALAKILVKSKRKDEGGAQ